MNWDQLLSAVRFGYESLPYHSTDKARSQFQRDYDRIVFSSPFRRLQNKTQVFPLPAGVFVHNRLTHSLEVASVGRSLGVMLTSYLQQRKDEIASKGSYVSEIGNIVAAACLAHDMGNPAFGHSGEKAISQYFTDGKGKEYKSLVSEAVWKDFCNFEGNANLIRVLCHGFTGKAESGFSLTYSTLAAMMKYPCESLAGGEAENIHQKKYGFFQSEKNTAIKIAQALGLIQSHAKPLAFVRHPLVYLVEAADDICYKVIDLEDAHRLNILQTKEVQDLLINLLPDAKKQKMLDKLAKLPEPGDKIAHLRAVVIGSLINDCFEAFETNYQAIMAGNFKSDLMHSLNHTQVIALQQIEAVSNQQVYNYDKAVEIELAGYQILKGLLSVFVPAVLEEGGHYQQKIRALMPAQYVYFGTDAAGRIQSVIDFISSMTDIYAVSLYRKIQGISFPALF